MRSIACKTRPRPVIYFKKICFSKSLINPYTVSVERLFFSKSRYDSEKRKNGKIFLSGGWHVTACTLQLSWGFLWGTSNWTLLDKVSVDLDNSNPTDWRKSCQQKWRALSHFGKRKKIRALWNKESHCYRLWVSSVPAAKKDCVKTDTPPCENGQKDWRIWGVMGVNYFFGIFGWCQYGCRFRSIFIKIYRGLYKRREVIRFSVGFSAVLGSCFFFGNNQLRFWLAYSRCLC